MPESPLEIVLELAPPLEIDLVLGEPSPQQLADIVPFFSAGGGSLRDTIEDVVEDLMGDPDHDFAADFLISLNT